MSTYISLESAIKDLVVANMTGYTSEVVRAGDMDGALNYAMKHNTGDPKFCILDFGGGSRDKSSSSFGAAFMWNHVVLVKFFIPLQAPLMTQEIENEIRTTYDSFLTTIASNRRCMGNNRSMAIDRVSRPLVYEISTQAYIMIAFEVVLTEALA